MSLDWLKHAFAIDRAEDFEPTETQRALVDRLCREVVARELTTPALLFLETVRPLNSVTAQSLQFFMPLLSTAGISKATEDLAAFLEHRGSIDYLCRRIDELSQDDRTAPTSRGDDSM